MESPLTAPGRVGSKPFRSHRAALYGQLRGDLYKTLQCDGSARLKPLALPAQCRALVKGKIMANTKEARIRRVRDVSVGTFTFTHIPTGTEVLCDMADLYPNPREADKPDGFTGDSFETVWAGLPSMIRHLSLWGVNAKVGDKGASADSDPQDMADAWDNLKANIWGSGGGSGSLSTYEVELRVHVARELIKIGYSKADANKAARKGDNPGAAYMEVAELTAIDMDIDGVTADIVYGIQYPKIEKAARKEADRRDKAESKGVTDLTEETRLAILAKATEATEKAAEEEKAAA